MSEVVPRVGTALARVPTDSEIDRMHRLAKAAAMSRSFKAVDGMTADEFAAQIFIKMYIGTEMGLSPGLALSGGIHIFDGNVQLASTTLGAAIRERGYDFKVTEHTDKVCTIEFFDRDGSSKGEVTYTWEDAQKQNLTGKKNWRTVPRNMLFARCLSNGVKWTFPEAMSGIPVYTEGDDFGDSVRVENLADGHGDGSDPGWGVVPPNLSSKVERTVKTAEKLGYKGLGDLFAIKQDLNHKSDQQVIEWLKQARDEIDAYVKEKEEEPADAEVVDESVNGANS